MIRLRRSKQENREQLIGLLLPVLCCKWQLPVGTACRLALRARMAGVGAAFQPRSFEHRERQSRLEAAPTIV